MFRSRLWNETIKLRIVVKRHPTLLRSCQTTALVVSCYQTWHQSCTYLSHTPVIIQIEAILSTVSAVVNSLWRPECSTSFMLCDYNWRIVMNRCSVTFKLKRRKIQKTTQLLTNPRILDILKSMELNFTHHLEPIVSALLCLISQQDPNDRITYPIKIIFVHKWYLSPANSSMAIYNP